MGETRKRARKKTEEKSKVYNSFLINICILIRKGTCLNSIKLFNFPQTMYMFTTYFAQEIYNLYLLTKIYFMLNLHAYNS